MQMPLADALIRVDKARQFPILPQALRQSPVRLTRQKAGDRANEILAATACSSLYFALQDRLLSLKAEDMAEKPKVGPIPAFRSMRIALITLQHLIPNVCGASWSKILPASDLPLNPVLSVCKLSLRAGINVSQEKQMAARFWAASLEYIRSIPNCTALYWASIENKPETLIAFLQWEDVSAWRSFQSSIGFRLMTAVLTTKCLNRASSIRLPDSITAGDIIEIAAFQLAATEPMVDFSAI